MKLDDIVSWYQKKIGTYDKELWEKTVEEKIFDGFTSGVTLKTAKLKTELIDVDLVRGSTFPKAKPKQSLLTVICLAVLRYIFFPLYAKWWVRQTTPTAFVLLFLLYILQMVNWAIYALYLNLNVNNEKSDCGTLMLNSDNTVNSTLSKRSFKGNSDPEISEHVISISELLIPMTLSFLLTFIHSQIVATKIIQSSCKASKRRRFANSTQNVQNRSSKETRQRRRKKVTRQRSHDLFNVYPIQIITQLKDIAAKVLPLHSEVCTKPSTDGTGKTSQLLNSFSVKGKSSIEFKKNNTHKSVALQTSIDDNENITAGNGGSGSDADFSFHIKQDKDFHIKQNNNECSLRRRNVNWHTPIHNYVNTGVEISYLQEPVPVPVPVPVVCESILNSNSLMDNSRLPFSTGSSASSNKTVRIDECVQEFYDELLGSSAMTITPEINEELDTAMLSNRTNDELLHQNGHRTLGEDDGFESLNGKSSSGEETLGSALPQLTKNQVFSRSISDNNIQNCIDDFTKCPMPAACVNVTSACNVTTTELSCHLNKGFRSKSVSSDDTEEDGDDGGLVNSADCEENRYNYNECTTSATEWMGITTNSEDCSYSSDIDNSDNYQGNQYIDELNIDFDSAPTTILNPYGTSDRISCTIWDRHEIKKAQMSVLDIASCIIENVESMPKINDYVYMGVFFAFLLSFIPCFYRLCEITFDTDKTNEVKFFDMPSILWEKASFSFLTILHFAFGQTEWERTILVLGFLQRLMLTLILFMIFAVAERTFKQRFLYAKLFSHLTSSRRARKSNLPHFRLNKVRNIKTWLSVRSYLKKRGPQRSVDVIVSAAFMLTLLLLGFLSVEWLKDTVRVHSHLNLEALLWSTTIGIYVLRYITLGNKIHHKYRSVSVLITEQINLYLQVMDASQLILTFLFVLSLCAWVFVMFILLKQIEKKPKKKEELMVSNSVLKLAADLLKELETPFKISGLSANPYLFTTIKVVILSALSGVLSEMLGFKLKLHKIKIK